MKEKLCFVGDKMEIERLDLLARECERSRSFLLRLAIREFNQKKFGGTNVTTKTV